MADPATIGDVARHAGVSKSTVSNVVRRADVVSAPTRERVEDARAQERHRLGAVAMLRALRLHRDDDSGRKMSDADRRLGLVDMLAARALRAHGLDAQIVALDIDIDLLDLRQYRYRCR